MERDGLKSIAFPALGTGKLGYPYYPVANTMCNVIHAYGKKHPRTKIERVYFFLYDKEELCKNVRKKLYRRLTVSPCNPVKFSLYLMFSSFRISTTQFID